jgi:hypothetical protein
MCITGGKSKHLKQLTCQFPLIFQDEAAPWWLQVLQWVEPRVWQNTPSSGADSSGDKVLHVGAQ